MYLARTALIGDTFQIELEFRNVGFCALGSEVWLPQLFAWRVVVTSRYSCSRQWSVAATIVCMKGTCYEQMLMLSAVKCGCQICLHEVYVLRADVYALGSEVWLPQLFAWRVLATSKCLCSRQWSVAAKFVCMKYTCYEQMFMLSAVKCGCHNCLHEGYLLRADTYALSSEVWLPHLFAWRVVSPGYPNLLGQAWQAFQPMRVRVAIRVSRFKTKQYFQDGGRRGFSIFWSFPGFWFEREGTCGNVNF